MSAGLRGPYWRKMRALFLGDPKTKGYRFQEGRSGLRRQKAFPVIQRRGRLPWGPAALSSCPPAGWQPHGWAELEESALCVGPSLGLCGLAKGPSCTLPTCVFPLVLE